MTFRDALGRPTPRTGLGGLRRLFSPGHRPQRQPAAVPAATGRGECILGRPESMAAVVEAFDVLQQQPGFDAMHVPSSWLSDMVREAPSWPEGCEHLRAGGDVALPVVGPAWLRTRYCWDCRPSAGADTVEGRTCDRCHRVCDPSEQAAHGRAQADTVLIYFLLCLACAAEEKSTGEAL